MRQSARKIRFATLGFSILFCGFMAGGCDQVEEFDESMAITPSSVTLTTSQKTTTFTAYLNTDDDPAAPLEWSVSSPSVGTIVSASGFTAVYRSSGRVGNNTVTARDQNGNQGSAYVTQTAESYGLTLTASPSSTIASGEDSCTITVAGGQPPYRWEVEDESNGEIVSGGTSDTVVYRSRGTGSNAVSVHDANSVSSSISITQEAPPPGPGG